ncbi:MAG: helix-turn-helix domain-containing protein [Clostridia bacterium]
MLKKNVLWDKTCIERIIFARKGKGDKKAAISQEALAIKFRTSNCKISRDTIADIESGVRDIFDIEVFWFAKVLEVPLNYLLGLTDQYDGLAEEYEPAIDNAMKNRKNICGTWIRYARYEQDYNSISQYELAEKMTKSGIKMSYYTILYIENGTRRVTLTELKHFAQVLGKPIEFLLKGTKPRLPNIESFESFAAEDD